MSDATSEKTAEALSAFVDDEASSFDVRLSVKELLGSEEAREQWARYNLIGDVLRSEVPDRIDSGFSSRVMAQVDGAVMDAPAGEPRQGGIGIARPLTGFALAASVAVITVVGVRSLSTPQDAPPSVPSIAATSPAPLMQNVTPAPMAMGTVPAGRHLSPQAQDRMNRYLARHAGYVSSNGMTPYARIVGYDMDGD